MFLVFRVPYFKRKSEPLYDHFLDINRKLISNIQVYSHLEDRKSQASKSTESIDMNIYKNQLYAVFRTQQGR